MVTSSKTPRKDSKIAFTPRTSSLVKYVYMTLKFLSLMRKKPSLSDGNYFEGDRGFGKIIMKFNLPTDFKYLKKFSTIKTT